MVRHKQPTETTMTKNYTTIAEALEAIQSLVPLMVEKGMVTPEVRYTHNDSDRADVWLRFSSKRGTQIGEHGFSVHHADTIREAVDKARAAIMALKDPEIEAIARYQRNIATAVDEGRADGIPEEYTKPVSAVIHTIHENLLEVAK
jgi:hypothetical protein